MMIVVLGTGDSCIIRERRIPTTIRIETPFWAVEGGLSKARLYYDDNWPRY